jgi:hypothetical protein
MRTDINTKITSVLVCESPLLAGSGDKTLLEVYFRFLAQSSRLIDENFNNLKVCKRPQVVLCNSIGFTLTPTNLHLRGYRLQPEFLAFVIQVFDHARLNGLKLRVALQRRQRRPPQRYFRGGNPTL